MLGRYWIAFIACLVVAGAAQAQEKSTTRVVGVEEVDGAPAVVLGAGQEEGLAEDVEVTLLREAEPIVHPLTGEVLGVPQEPVGVARIFSVDDRRARGRMVKSYSQPQVGDLAEFQLPVMLEERDVDLPPSPAATEMAERVKSLEKEIAQYKKAKKTISAYPVFAQQVWDELKGVKSYLVDLDERLIELETQQGEDRNRLNSMLRGEYRAEEAKEFTIRYSPDTDVRLRVAGKTLVISVEKDSLHVEEMGEDLPSDLGEIEVKENGEEGGIDLGFLNSPYVQAGSLAVIGALGAVLYFLMKRREEDVMDELEDFDEEYMDDEEEY